MFLNLSGPIQVQWEVTPWCNHLCIHCYNYWRGEGRGGKIRVSSELLDTYESTVSNLINHTVFAVTITGGEPLVMFDTLFPYLVRLHDAGIDMGMNTNLTLLTEEKARKLTTVGINTVLTSLMSYRPEVNDSLANTPGAHAKIVRGIKIAQEAGIKVAVNMVVTKQNLDDVYPTAEFVSSLGINSFCATKAATPGNAPDFSPYRIGPEQFHIMLAELVRAKDDFGIAIDSLEFYPPCAFPTPEIAETFGSRICTAGKTSCTIGFDGMIRPCSHAPMSYGSILNGLNIAWKNLDPWRTDKYLPEECKRCPLKYHCGGGCKIEAYVANGRLDSIDPYCQGPAYAVRNKRTPKKSREPIDTKLHYRVSKSTRIRHEDFGGILFGAKRKWVAVDRNLYEFISQRIGGKFERGELAQALGIEDSLVQLSLHLLSKKAIIQQV